MALEDGCHCRGHYYNYKDFQLTWKLDGPEHESGGIGSPRRVSQSLASCGMPTLASENISEASEVEGWQSCPWTLRLSNPTFHPETCVFHTPKLTTGNSTWLI